jgi:hypothetical protein
MTLPILKAPLSQEIQSEYDKLINLITPNSTSARILKQIEGTGGKVSISDLIAYQIGWGKRLIEWYESGIKGEFPIMPGEGFLTWDYTAIARHFYQKYQYHQNDEQNQAFHQVVLQLLDIAEKEHQTGNLARIGVCSWCTLQSGKQWPLSKWIKINTSSPYKRAFQLIKKASY